MPLHFFTFMVIKKGINDKSDALKHLQLEQNVLNAITVPADHE